MLSDDPYGDFNPIPWLDSQAFVPDVAIGRLVETPADISKAVDQFVASNGVRAPTTAYTAGYDFNADGAQLSPTGCPARTDGRGLDVDQQHVDQDGRDQRHGRGRARLLVRERALRRLPALPADEFSGGTQNQLLTTADLPSDLGGGILFTIGCHAGLNVADTFVATTTESRAPRRTGRSPSRRAAASSPANTGYGYGDSSAVAYSERLMADFATNLDGSMTVGQALMFAKHSYRAPAAGGRGREGHGGGHLLRPARCTGSARPARSPRRSCLRRP